MQQEGKRILMLFVTNARWNGHDAPRLTFPAATACASFFEVLEDSIGLGNLLLRFGFEHFAQAKAQPIEDGRYRTGGGHVLLGTP